MEENVFDPNAISHKMDLQSRTMASLGIDTLSSNKKKKSTHFLRNVRDKVGGSNDTKDSTSRSSVLSYNEDDDDDDDSSDSDELMIGRKRRASRTVSNMDKIDAVQREIDETMETVQRGIGMILFCYIL